MLVTANKRSNLANAKRLVTEASTKGAKIIVLPECFNSPYGTNYFPEYAEPLGYRRVVHGGYERVTGSETVDALSQMASESAVYLIGGSFPEASVEEGRRKLYNTCTIWNPSGMLIGVHRKIHLFDIDVPGKITFQESQVLSPGSQLTQVETEYGSIGIGICYDIRFPEVAMIAARRNRCIAMVYPGAFNMTTGPMHWELLLRARALDNQLYVCGCAPARDNDASYTSWGHSTVVDPMGRVVGSTDASESIVYADLDVAQLQSTRDSIPVSRQRRFDLYPDVSASLGSN